MKNNPTIMICREGYEDILREEMIAKGAFPEPAGLNLPTFAASAGLLVNGAPTEAADTDRVSAPFIFEQQRLEAACWRWTTVP